MKKAKKLEYTCLCGSKNTREDIGYSQEATILYNITFNKDVTVDEYEEFDQVFGDGGVFFCKNCGDDLAQEEKEALKIIQ